MKKKCKYCESGVPLRDGSSWIVEIGLQNKLEIACDFASFEYIKLDINFCPMCGRKLK